MILYIYIYIYNIIYDIIYIIYDIYIYDIKYIYDILYIYIYITVYTFTIYTRIYCMGFYYQRAFQKLLSESELVRSTRPETSQTLRKLFLESHGLAPSQRVEPHLICLRSTKKKAVSPIALK